MHVIVVFGCPTDIAGNPTPALRRRLVSALRLAEADPTAVLLLSGGAVTSSCEALAMRGWLRRAGIPRERLLVDPISRDTIDNASECAAIIARLGAARISLVTERYHVGRSTHWLSLALRRRGLDVPVGVHPAPDRLDGSLRLLAATRERVKLAGDQLRILWRWR